MPPSLARVSSHGYDRCVALSDGPARLVLGHHAGGRVLEFSFQGHNAIYTDPGQDGWTLRPDAPGVDLTGGRCDFGPETLAPPHPALWLGPWTVASTDPGRARLASTADPATGIRLEREFRLHTPSPEAVRVDFTQTIHNVGAEACSPCHWGRTFAPGGGICVIPLDGRSRFPEGYVHYGPNHAIHYRPSLLQDAQVRLRDGFVEVLGAPRFPKLGFDSMVGWFAYLMPGDVAFVKRYPTWPGRLYNEVASLTISIYYPAPLCELEPIGPREDLAPGASAAFTEEWYLVRFPFPRPGGTADLAALSSVVAGLPR